MSTKGHRPQTSYLLVLQSVISDKVIANCFASFGTEIALFSDISKPNFLYGDIFL